MKGKGNKHFWNKGVDQGDGSFGPFPFDVSFIIFGPKEPSPWSTPDAFCDTMISQIKQQSEEYP